MNQRLKLYTFDNYYESRAVDHGTGLVVRDSSVV